MKKQNNEPDFISTLISQHLRGDHSGSPAPQRPFKVRPSTALPSLRQKTVVERGFSHAPQDSTDIVSTGRCEHQPIGSQKEAGPWNAEGNPLLVELWLEKTLDQCQIETLIDDIQFLSGQFAHAQENVQGQEQKQKGAEVRTKLRGLGIDRETLVSKGLSLQTVDRVFRALFVYSTGFHHLLQDIEQEAFPHDRKLIVMSLWTTFLHLLEKSDERYHNKILKTIEEVFSIGLRKAEHSLTVAREEIGQLESQTEALKFSKTELLSSMAMAHEDSWLQLLRQKNGFDQEKLNMTSQIQDILQANAQLSEAYRITKCEVKQLEAEKLVALEDRARALESLQSGEAEYQLAREKLSLKERRLEKLTEQIKVLREQLSEGETMIGKAKIETRNAVNQAARFAQDLKKEQLANAQQKANYVAVVEESRQQESQIESLKEENSQLTKDLKAAREELERLTSQHDMSEGELEAVAKMINGETLIASRNKRFTQNLLAATEETEKNLRHALSWELMSSILGTVYSRRMMHCENQKKELRSETERMKTHFEGEVAFLERLLRETENKMKLRTIKADQEKERLADLETAYSDSLNKIKRMVNEQNVLDKKLAVREEAIEERDVIILEHKEMLKAGEARESSLAQQVVDLKTTVAHLEIKLVEALAESESEEEEAFDHDEKDEILEENNNREGPALPLAVDRKCPTKEKPQASYSSPKLEKKQHTKPNNTLAIVAPRPQGKSKKERLQIQVQDLEREKQALTQKLNATTSRLNDTLAALNSAKDELETFKTRAKRMTWRLRAMLALEKQKYADSMATAKELHKKCVSLELAGSKSTNNFKKQLSDLRYLLQCRSEQAEMAEEDLRCLRRRQHETLQKEHHLKAHLSNHIAQLREQLNDEELKVLHKKVEDSQHALLTTNQQWELSTQENSKLRCTLIRYQKSLLDLQKVNESLRKDTMPETSIATTQTAQGISSTRGVQCDLTWVHSVLHSCTREELSSHEANDVENQLLDSGDEAESLRPSAVHTTRPPETSEALASE